MDVITFIPEKEYEQFMAGILIPYDKEALNHTHELVLGSCFNIDLLTYTTDVTLSLGPSHFNTISVLEGECDLLWSGGSRSLSRGETILIPRPVGEYTVKASSVTAIRSFL